MNKEEEKIINGKLCWLSESGVWHTYSQEQLTNMILKLRKDMGELAVIYADSMHNFVSKNTDSDIKSGKPF